MRRLHMESLEDRLMLTVGLGEVCVPVETEAAPAIVWMPEGEADRPVTPNADFFMTDVNRDGYVTPLDALLVVTTLTDGPIDLDYTIYPDVNDDGYVSPIDAFLVIEHLTDNYFADLGA